MKLFCVALTFKIFFNSLDPDPEAPEYGSEALIPLIIDEDVVAHARSLNVLKASLVSADCSWEPGFTEMSPAELILRKLLSVSDLTVCLDRRGALGKIEIYEVRNGAIFAG